MRIMTSTSHRPAVGFEKEQIEKELEDWNREGRERYLTELITTMVGKEEGEYVE